jgi:hypothetical protein
MWQAQVPGSRVAGRQRRGEVTVRIGLVVGLHGRVEGEPPAPTWADIRAQAEAAEQAGFDTLVMEDALLFPSPRGAVGY